MAECCPGRALIADGERMEVHCYDCGRCRVMDPASLPLSPDEFVAGLGGRFRCTRCGSRKTEARGHIDYSKIMPGYPKLTM